MPSFLTWTLFRCQSAQEIVRYLLGPECERVYEELVNTLGNPTLTAYNPELSDAPFPEKKAQPQGRYLD